MPPIPLPALAQNAPTKDRIIHLLGGSQPLSIKEIYSALHREFGTEITYQAVHKMLKEMESKGTLKKEQKKYELNPAWIQNMKQFTSSAEAAYLGRKKQHSEQIATSGSSNFSFRTVMDMGRFIIDIFARLPNPEKKPAACRWWSMWPIIALSDSEYLSMKEGMSKTQYYFIGKNSTVVDKSFADSFRALGAKVKLGVNVPFTPDYMVQGDYIASVYFRPSLLKLWHKLCLKAKTKMEMDKMLHTLFEQKDSVDVIVNRNPAVAEQVRRETLAHFKGAK